MIKSFKKDLDHCEIVTGIGIGNNWQLVIGIGIREGKVCQTDWQKEMINILITVKADWTGVHPLSFFFYFSPNPTGVSPSPNPNWLTMVSSGVESPLVIINFR